MLLVVINVDKENLAKKLVNAHYEYVGVYLKVFDFLSSSGEDGVLYKLYLSENQEFTASALSDELEISSERMTNILNQLEKKKIINRKKRNDDKRKMYNKNYLSIYSYLYYLEIIFY